MRRPGHATALTIAATFAAWAAGSRPGLLSHHHADGDHAHVHAAYDHQDHGHDGAEHVHPHPAADGPSLAGADHDPLHWHAFQLLSGAHRTRPAMAVASTVRALPQLAPHAVPPGRPHGPVQPRAPPSDPLR